MLNFWKEGEFIDPWSIPHFLFGVIFAGIFYYLGVHFWIAVIISFCLMVSWEFYEKGRGFKEKIPNKILGVILGLTGFFIMTFLMINLKTPYNLGLFILTLGILLILEMWGFRAYKIKYNKSII